MFKKNTDVIGKKVGSVFRRFFNLGAEERKEPQNEEVYKSEERKVERVASEARQSEQVVDEVTIK